MKLGKDIGISPIKFLNKDTNKSMEEVIYHINDILYKYSFRYVSAVIKCKLLDAIKELGTQASGIKCTGKDVERKNELMSKLRVIYKSLNSYLPDDNQAQAKSSINYLVAITIKTKKDMNSRDILDFFDKYKEYMNEYPYLTSKDTATIDKLYDEFVSILIQNIKR